MSVNFRTVSLIIILALLPPNVFAKIITAASGSRSDIQTAVNATSKGDTVKIPAGQFSLSGTVQIDAGITIMGTGIDQTIRSTATIATKFSFEVDAK